MNLASAPEKARGLGDGASTAAARLYNDIEQELALGSYSEEDADAGEDALSILEERFPGVRAAARGVTDPPKLSHSAKRTLDADDADDAGDDDEEEEAPRGGRSSSGPTGPRTRRAGSSRSSSSGRRVVERAAGFSDDDVSGAVITGLQFLLAAGLAYQLLQPKGATAFGGVLGAIGRGFSVFVAPVDPLAGLGAGSQIEQGYQTVQSQIAQAAAANPNVFDTPSGTAPYSPPSNLPGSGGSGVGASPGQFDTPGGVSVYKPPSALSRIAAGAGMVVTGPLGSLVPTNLFPTPTG